MKNILFRTDSSSIIGTGHIMRDLVLAKQYKENNIIFATQNLQGNINHKIEEDAYEIVELNSNDIDEVLILIEKYSIDMIIIDHYGIDWQYEKALKETYSSLIIFSFDDTYERHYCDILLNHNISGDEKRYEDLVPEYCELRCGSKYTLLRDEFIEEKKRQIIFLAMGGADHSHINIKIFEVLREFSNIKVNLVTTSANQNLKALQVYVEDKKWIKLHINSNEIARLMKMSDFAIVTPSVTLNEIFYMEIPFVAIKTADNQEDMYAYLVQNRYSVLENFDAKKLKNIIINKDITLINFTDLLLEEKEMVLAWRNHTSIRKWMHFTEIISLNEHLNYIKMLSSKEERVYFLVKYRDEAIGVINFTDIDIINSRSYFGLYAKPNSKGFGSTLMHIIIDYALNILEVKQLIAEVFDDNHSAIKLYDKFGFTEKIKRDNIIIMELKNENR